MLKVDYLAVLFDCEVLLIHSLIYQQKGREVVIKIITISQTE